VENSEFRKVSVFDLIRPPVRQPEIEVEVVKGAEDGTSGVGANEAGATGRVKIRDQADVVRG
jgi:hypothetical protein